MMDRRTTRYPVYVPSKGRYEKGYTPRFLIEDEVPFRLVVEPQEAEAYGSRYGFDRLLVLPWRGDDEVRRAFCAERGIPSAGLIAVRNWIKEHATQEGHARHWQLDDNIRHVERCIGRKRVRCHSGFALAWVEDFADRYENIAIAGLNYRMFNRGDAPPFYLNSRVYSCSLVLNSLPNRWRLPYNDDVDICLQVLTDGWCTVNVNAFLIEKMTTMVAKGGNTDDLYQGFGRLEMAQMAARQWPGVVKTKRKFGRAQHHVEHAWRQFDNKLIPATCSAHSTLTRDGHG